MRHICAFRYSSTKAASPTTVDNAALTEEYKQEISDLWETYAMREARKQCMVGIVTSTKNDKTITVTVTRQVLITKYRKWINRRKRFLCHDEEESANVGDLVRVVPMRRRGARKNHKLMDILIREGQLPHKRDHEANLKLLLALDPPTTADEETATAPVTIVP